jgi:hypothetical protein
LIIVRRMGQVRHLLWRRETFPSPCLGSFAFRLDVQGPGGREKREQGKRGKGGRKSVTIWRHQTRRFRGKLSQKRVTGDKGAFVLTLNREFLVVTVLCVEGLYKVKQGETTKLLYFLSLMNTTWARSYYIIKQPPTSSFLLETETRPCPTFNVPKQSLDNRAPREAGRFALGHNCERLLGRQGETDTHTTTLPTTNCQTSRFDVATGPLRLCLTLLSWLSRTLKQRPAVTPHVPSGVEPSLIF